jgi:hypothetical protein
VRRSYSPKTRYTESHQVISTRLAASVSRYLSIVLLHKLTPADMRDEAHTRKPPFATISSDFAVVGRIMNGERPRWPLAPVQGHDVSAGVKELSESCWNSDPVQRPTAQAIVEVLARVIDQDDTLPLVLQSSPITSNANASTLEEPSKVTSSDLHEAWDGVPATKATDHRMKDGFDSSKLFNAVHEMPSEK